MSVEVPGDVLSAVEQIVQSGQEGDALILSIDKAKSAFAVASSLKGQSPEAIAEELPESVPRLIISRHTIDVDSQHKKEFIFFIHFNPMSCSTPLMRLYSGAKSDLLGKSKLLKERAREVELNDARDFNLTWFAVKVRGLTGKAGNPLPGQYSSGGYDGRM